MQVKIQEDNKTEFTVDEFGNKKFGNLKSFTESKNYQLTMSKEYQEISSREKSKTLPKLELKPVKNRSLAAK